MVRHRRRQFIYRIRKPLVTMISLAFALLAGEVAVRLLIEAPRIHRIAVSEEDSPYMRSSNPILRYELKPDFHASHPNGMTRTNSHGNRDRPREYKKPDGVTRIILLGDSVVESVNLLGDDETINIQTEKLFADGKTEVLNLAVAGYCTRAEVELLRVKGLKYQPDAVVVVFVENDFQNFNPDHSFDTQYLQRPLGVDALLRYSHLFRSLCVQANWFGFSNNRSENWNQQALGNNNVADGFQLLRELSKEHGFEVIVGIWPAFTDTAVMDLHVLPDKPDHLVVEHLAWSNGIPTFRFSPHFRRDWEGRTHSQDVTTPRRFYTVNADTMHPSPQAAQIAARVLHSVLAGQQATQLEETSSDVQDVASQLGVPKEPPDPLLERTPAYAVMLKQNRQRDAEAYIERLLEEDPSDADAWCLKAGSHGANGDMKMAMECYDHALSINPNHVEALVWRGVIAYASNQPELATESFRRALEHYPKHPRASFHLGLVYAPTSPNQAVKYFRRAVELFPDYVDAHHELAKVYLSLDQPKKAEQACRRAIELEHNNAEAHFHLGVSYSMQTQLDAAIKSFDVAIRLNSNFAAAYFASSEAAQEMGDISSAIRRLRRAIELHPGWLEPTKRLAWLLATAKDDTLRNGKEAVKLAAQCVNQDKNYQTLNVLAAAHAEAGDFKSAVERQKQSIRQAPQHALSGLRTRLELYEQRLPYRD